MTPETALLTRLAHKVALAHQPLPGAAAALVTGSVARGQADTASDIDMGVYYADALPDDAAREQICAALGGQRRRLLGADPGGGTVIDAFDLGGVEVQLIHALISAVDADLDEVLVRHNPDTPLAKLVEGHQVAVAFYGEAQVEAWRRRASHFPPELGIAMVRHHVRFFPAWGVMDQFLTRDATVWYHQILVENSQNLLGVLAGLSGVFYTPFQFKRMKHFVQKLTIAPTDLLPRLEGLYGADVATALPALETLVAETVTLVEAQMPEIDTSAVRRRLGFRRPRWEPDAIRAALS